ncbi:probable LRR receptor-like serine/threonine-protein kinase At4g31250 [Mercurialis annua]|uniref:probable LRR receptor-like serine/threonine-protein kinase At4g31250 n=1 Tax=Mercurialis annua TaxID=3986 RepID=UPI00215E2D27|nr:probable LRR receptor-like serine/threonine-protein kinase At4g31250 [Mercurialis annua]
MPHRRALCFPLATLILFTVVILLHAVPGSADDADALIAFKNSLSNPSLLSDWTKTTPPCSGNTSNWVGVHCNNDGDVDKLTLESMGLSGQIELDSLAQLLKMRALSFKNNSFEGGLPAGLTKLTFLKTLYLSFNQFSGVLPDNAFLGMSSLTQLFLGYNDLSGPIPSSLVPLSRLVRLGLEDNRFEGQIPEFQQQFTYFNVSGNHLKGHIPSALSALDITSFTGNDGLCGKPLLACKSSKHKMLIIIVVVAASVLALAAILAFAYLRSRRRRQGTKTTQINQLQVQRSQPQTKFANIDDGKTIENNDNNGKLHFVRNDQERFELQELLRASAEVLGSSEFGPSYKAVVTDGRAMVAKRFREMSNVRRDEFEEHMTRLGALSHRNLLPLVAFYYRKDEKLLISDFIENGSLASHLHTTGGIGLEWGIRLKIIKGVARGLAYLHRELPSLTLPHGHLKSSNVLLDHTLEPLLTDYALLPLVNKPHALRHMIAYTSPDSDRASRKTDVWSLGILILEMLTGKVPANYRGRGGNGDLATWVNSVVREEWTGEVFDMKMRGTKNGEGEMLKLLKIGMCCCEWKVERRWDLTEAVDKIEQLNERDSDFDEFSSNASDADIYSSRAITDDDFSFSITG